MKSRLRQLAELGKAPTRARGGGGVRVCHAGCGGDGGKAPAAALAPTTRRPARGCAKAPTPVSPLKPGLSGAN